MEKPALIVPFGMDYGRSSTGEVCPSQLGPRSIARLDAAAQFFSERDNRHDMFVVSPGIQPEEEEPCPTMAHMMGEYLSVAHNIDPVRIICAEDPDLWGTAAELRFATRTHSGFLHTEFIRHQLVFVSGRYHLPRIHLMVLAMVGIRKYRQTEMKFIQAPGDTATLRLAVHEVLAVPYNLLRIWSGRA